MSISAINILKIYVIGNELTGECSKDLPCIDSFTNKEIEKFSVILPELTNELVDEWIDLGINVKINNTAAIVSTI